MSGLLAVASLVWFMSNEACNGMLALLLNRDVVKHRRELCGTVPAQPPIPVSAVHEVLERAARGSASLEDALRLAVQSAEEAQTACDRAADLVGDRSCRIFLKILCQESLSHREELVGALRRFERERSSAAEDVAA